MLYPYIRKTTDAGDMSPPSLRLLEVGLAVVIGDTILVGEGLGHHLLDNVWAGSLRGGDEGGGGEGAFLLCFSPPSPKKLYEEKKRWKLLQLQL